MKIKDNDENINFCLNIIKSNMGNNLTDLEMIGIIFYYDILFRNITLKLKKTLNSRNIKVTSDKNIFRKIYELKIIDEYKIYFELAKEINSLKDIKTSNIKKIYNNLNETYLIKLEKLIENIK